MKEGIKLKKIFITLSLGLILSGILTGCGSVSYTPPPVPSAPQFSFPVESIYGSVIDVDYEKSALDFVVVKYQKEDLLNLVTYKLDPIRGYTNLESVITIKVGK